MSGPPADRVDAIESDTPVTVAGERLCPKCGYSLLGQSIVREPHYDMLIVRCPECGAVTSMLEYPRLARWSRALGAAGAAVWLLLLLGATTISMWILVGAVIVASESAGANYAFHLNRLHQEVVEADRVAAQAKAQAASKAGGGDADAGGDGGEDPVAAAGPAAPPVIGTVTMPDGRTLVQTIPGVPPGVISVPSEDFSVWWATQNPAVVLDDAGGWMRQIDPRVLIILIPFSLAVFAVGCFWSVALTFASPRWLFGWIAFLAALTFIFALVAWWDWTTNDNMWNYRVARAEIGRRIVWFVYAYTLIPLIAGALAGRGLARLLVRALLPPSWRAPLAFLWTTSGKRPPVI